MKNKFYYILAAIVLIFSFSVTAFASGGSAANLKSHGRIVFDNDTEDASDDIVFDASDLVYIATKVDAFKASVN